MSTPRSPVRNGQWAIYSALALTVAGIIYQGGILSGRVDNNDRRITKLEASDVSDRLARMEGKIDVLTARTKP